MTEIHERGSREYRALTGRDPQQALASLREQAPQMYRWLLDGAFGQPLADARLPWRDREIATVAVLTALGGMEPQLRVHLQAALRHDITGDELRALVEHVSVYAGFPRALGVLDLVGQVLADHPAATPVPARSVALSDHTTEIARAGGTGPAVVLLHALGLTWHMWEPVMRPLARGRRVLAYDLRGHGSAAGAPAPEDMTVLADDLRDVLDAEGLGAAHIVGLSYGGGIAQTFAARHPDAVLSLALVATTGRPFDAFTRRAADVERDGAAAQVASSLSRWFTPEGLSENGWGVRYARECVRRGDPVQVAAAWRAFSRLDVAGALSDWDRPTLVLCGEADASTGPQVMTALAADIAGARYVQLPGAPHMPTLETPRLVIEALDRFLPSPEVAGDGVETACSGRRAASPSRG